MNVSLQDQFAPQSICFGCGPANSQGLQIKSFVQDQETLCEWKPQSFHEAFPGMLNGGIIGSLLDCHSNWTAAYLIMQKRGDDAPPCTVTAEYKVKLLKPTPSNQPVKLKAWATEVTEKKALIKAELTAAGEITATCEGFFVAVKPGHPAYHRWA